LGKKRAHSSDGSPETPQEGDRQPDGWRQAIGMYSFEKLMSSFIWPTLLLDQTETNHELHRYVGQNSIPALLRDRPSPDTKDGIDIRRDMRPIFGLDTSAPFPLMSAKHLDMMTQDIFTELPPDREVMMYVYS
jgi:hypothetical protein